MYTLELSGRVDDLAGADISREVVERLAVAVSTGGEVMAALVEKAQSILESKKEE